MNYIIHYDVAALLITLMIIVQYYSNRRISLGVRRVFVVMLVTEACTSALDLFTVYAIENPMSVPLAFNYLLNMAYLLGFNSVPMLYYVYVREAIRPSAKWKKWEYVSAFGPFAISSVLILTTAWTHGIFYFENDKCPEVYMGSADWMPRNLDKRVEIMFPVEDEKLKEQVIHILKVQLEDNVKAYILKPDGAYEKIDKRGKALVAAQEQFCREAIAMAAAQEQGADVRGTRVFVPAQP